MDAGFSNGIVNQFDPASEWFNPDIIPAIPKLLRTDISTLVNGMEQLNHSKDLTKIEEVTRREADAVVAQWASPGFMKRMMMYMMKSGVGKKKKNKGNKLKS